MKNDSCYKCENRHLGCHNNCEIYENYKTNIQKIKMNKKLEDNLNFRRRKR